MDKSHPLSVEMATIHTASTLDRGVLQMYSLQELEYSSVHKYFTLL